MPDARRSLRDLLEPGVNAVGFELVDVELIGRGAGMIVRVYIDHARGVTIDDCAEVSRQLSAILDVEDPIADRYRLEVSSPGLDRPLVRPQDFSRFVGSQVRLKLKQPIEGRRNFVGTLIDSSADDVVVEVTVTGGARERARFALRDIERARLVPEI